MLLLSLLLLLLLLFKVAVVVVTIIVVGVVIVAVGFFCYICYLNKFDRTWELYLLHEVASGSDISPCNKIDKPQVD